MRAINVEVSEVLKKLDLSAQIDLSAQSYFFMEPLPLEDD